MNREVLHRFFMGNVTVQEGMAIKAWVERSEENKRIFIKERRLFDALMLQDEKKFVATTKQKSRLLTFAYRGMKIAAVVMITLISYHILQTNIENQEQPALTAVSVPAGQRTQVTLSDGTQVWLNACSYLYYPAQFNKEERRVILKGEGYFDVTPNKEKPFIVETEQYNVEVLGTQFNVDAYNEVFETALMKGSVRVMSKSNLKKNVTLKPNEKVNVQGGNLIVSKIDDISTYRWKEGLICFQKTPFQSIMKKFEKCYDIKIVIQNNKMLDYSFTGKFRQADGVEYALNLLQKDIHFQYNKDDRENIIYIH